MNNTTVDVSNDDVRFHFHYHHQSNLLNSTLKMGNPISILYSYYGFQLYNAADYGCLEEVKDLLSKGVGTGYRNVS